MCPSFQVGSCDEEERPSICSLVFCVSVFSQLVGERKNLTIDRSMNLGRGVVGSDVPDLGYLCTSKLRIELSVFSL